MLAHSRFSSGAKTAALIAGLGLLGACQQPGSTPLPVETTAAAVPAPGIAREGKPAAPAKAASEADLIRVLESAATPMEKDEACVQLKRIGTSRCVPALAALLTDEQLAHSARYVLEAMSAPAAGQSLIDAVGKTTGRLKVGLVTSLGVRREKQAVPVLIPALHDADSEVAIAAATALGEIGNDAALAALQAAGEHLASPVQRAVVDATLRCAYQLLADGNSERALLLFQKLRAGASDEAVRVAAFRGLLLAAGPQALPLACAAIAGPVNSDQTTALQLVHELRAPGATAAFAQLLPAVAAPLQVALIEGLSQRNDPSILAAISALAGAPAAEVRLAVLRALGNLGDATSVALLSETAAHTTGVEQAAAREALVTLHRGAPGEAMLTLLPTAPPATQSEIARALAARRERAAIPKLVALARDGSASASKAAVLALARLGEEEPAALAGLVGLVVEARDDAARAQAAVGLASACQHIRFRHGHVDVAPLVHGLGSGSVAARLALLPICAAIVDPEIRTALRAAIADADARIRDAAISALCDSTDTELLPDLVRLACAPPRAELRTAAVAACVRLASDDDAPLTEAQRLAPLRAILAASPDAEQQRLVLTGLATVPAIESLSLAEPLLRVAAVRDAAADTVLALAPLLPDTARVTSALETIRDTQPAGALQQAAQLALRQSQSGFGFLTVWQTTGPFRQDGRDYADLFDFVYKPESDDPKGVKWKPLPAATGATRTWLVEMGSVTGPRECVAYAQTWLHCDREQPVRLELGSDALVKIWLNEKLIHTHNMLRVLHPGTDKITATLQPGWNSVLVKIAQRTPGAAFCLRLLQPDGDPVANLQVSAAGPAQN